MRAPLVIQRQLIARIIALKTKLRDKDCLKAQPPLLQHLPD